MTESIDINRLRFGDLPVSWVVDEEGDSLLRVEGFNGDEEQIASALFNGRWYTFRNTAGEPHAVDEGCADSVEVAKAAAINSLIEAGVLTIVAPTKFVRAADTEVSRSILDVVCIESTDVGGFIFTVPMPTLQADTLAFFLSAFGVPAESYEV